MRPVVLAELLDFGDEALESFGGQAFFFCDFGFQFAQSGRVSEVVHGKSLVSVDDTGHPAAVIRLPRGFPILLNGYQFFITYQL